MQVVADHGWLKAGTDVMDGIADVEAFDRVDPVAAAFCGTGVPLEAYQQIYRLQDFHAIGHDRALLDLYDGLLGGNVIRQPLSIARVMVPGSKAAPPRRTRTSSTSRARKRLDRLVPARRLPGRARRADRAGRLARRRLADLPRGAGRGRAGGVHLRLGLRLGRRRLRGRGRADVQQPHRAPGDAQPAGERVRLSVDMRYQRADEPITRARSAALRHPDWDEVYEGWTDPSLQHYWDGRGLQLVDWHEELRWQKNKIC